MRRSTALAPAVLEYAYLVSIGPRLEVDSLNPLPQNPCTAPYEELRIRAR